MDWLQQYLTDGRLRYEHRILGLPPVRPAPGFTGFLSAVLAIGTTDNGVFGVKVHWDQFAAAVVAAAAEQTSIRSDVDFVRWWLTDVQVIHLTRRERLLQALSHYRAQHSGLWAKLDEDVDFHIPEVDFNEIDRILQRNITWDERWNEFFIRSNIEPIRVIYEELVENYAAVVTAVLSELGLQPTSSVSPPRLRRQADQWTQDQVDAYLNYQRIKE